VRAEHRRYRRAGAVTDLHEFPDRAHTLTMDSGWREVAEDVLAWLAAQGLAPAGPGTSAIPEQRVEAGDTAGAGSPENRPAPPG
jgi:hypothetical protein